MATAGIHATYSVLGLEVLCCLQGNEVRAGPWADQWNCTRKQHAPRFNCFGTGLGTRSTGSPLLLLREQGRMVQHHVIHVW